MQRRKPKDTDIYPSVLAGLSKTDIVLQPSLLSSSATITVSSPITNSTNGTRNGNNTTFLPTVTNQDPSIPSQGKTKPPSPQTAIGLSLLSEIHSLRETTVNALNSQSLSSSSSSTSSSSVLASVIDTDTVSNSPVPIPVTVKPPRVPVSTKPNLSSTTSVSSSSSSSAVTMPTLSTNQASKPMLTQKGPTTTNTSIPTNTRTTKAVTSSRSNPVPSSSVSSSSSSSSSTLPSQRAKSNPRTHNIYPTILSNAQRITTIPEERYNSSSATSSSGPVASSSLPLPRSSSSSSSSSSSPSTVSVLHTTVPPVPMNHPSSSISSSSGSSATVQSLRKELQQLTEAYGTLIKEYRNSKTEWSTINQQQNEDILKLKNSLLGYERTRRDYQELQHKVKEYRKETDEAKEVAVTLKDKYDEMKRAKENAERRSLEYFEQLKDIAPKIRELTTASVEGEGARAQVTALTTRATDAEQRVRTLLKEREALLDVTQELQNKMTIMQKHQLDAHHQLQTVQSIQTKNETLMQLSQEQETRIDNLINENQRMERVIQQTKQEQNQLLEARTRVSELETVQEQLLHAIQLQTTEIDRLKQINTDAVKDSRRVQRLSRALEAYRTVEHLFASRTGQGFFGPNGIVFEAQLDIPKPTIRSTTLDPDTTLTAATQSVVDYLDKLRSGLEKEIRTELADTIAKERSECAARIAEAEHKMIEHQRTADNAVNSRDALEHWIRKITAIEDTISSLVFAPYDNHHSAVGTSNLSSTVNPDIAPIDATDPDVNQDPLYTTEWYALPSFVAALPRLATAVGRMRTHVVSALRRRRIAEAEVQDLREELALLRGQDIASVMAHRVASVDIRNTLKEGSEERNKLRQENHLLRTQIDTLTNQNHTIELQLHSYKEQLNAKNEEVRQTLGNLTDTEHRLDEQRTLGERMKAELIVHEQRWRDAKVMNEQALTLLAERDITLTRLRLRMRALRARIVQETGNTMFDKDDDDDDDDDDNGNGKGSTLGNRKEKNDGLTVQTLLTNGTYSSITVPDNPYYYRYQNNTHSTTSSRKDSGDGKKTKTGITNESKQEIPNPTYDTVSVTPSSSASVITDSLRHQPLRPPYTKSALPIEENKESKTEARQADHHTDRLLTSPLPVRSEGSIHTELLETLYQSGPTQIHNPLSGTNHPVPEFPSTETNLEEVIRPTVEDDYDDAKMQATVASLLASSVPHPHASTVSLHRSTNENKGSTVSSLAPTPSRKIVSKPSSVQRATDPLSANTTSSRSAVPKDNAPSHQRTPSHASKSTPSTATMSKTSSNSPRKAIGTPAPTTSSSLFVSPPSVVGMSKTSSNAPLSSTKSPLSSHVLVPSTGTKPRGPNPEDTDNLYLTDDEEQVTRNRPHVSKQESTPTIHPMSVEGTTKAPSTKYAVPHEGFPHQRSDDPQWRVASPPSVVLPAKSAANPVAQPVPVPPLPVKSSTTASPSRSSLALPFPPERVPLDKKGLMNMYSIANDWLGTLQSLNPHLPKEALTLPPDRTKSSSSSSSTSPSTSVSPQQQPSTGSSASSSSSPTTVTTPTISKPSSVISSISGTNNSSLNSHSTSKAKKVLSSSSAVLDTDTKEMNDLTESIAAVEKQIATTKALIPVASPLFDKLLHSSHSLIASLPSSLSTTTVSVSPTKSVRTGHTTIRSTVAEEAQESFLQSLRAEAHESAVRSRRSSIASNVSRSSSNKSNASHHHDRIAQHYLHNNGTHNFSSVSVSSENRSRRSSVHSTTSGGPLAPVVGIGIIGNHNWTTSHAHEG